MNKKQYPHSPGMRGKYGETASKRKQKTGRAGKTAADVCGTATLRRGCPFQWEANMKQKSTPKAGPQGAPKPLDAPSTYCVEGRTFVVQPVFRETGETTLATLLLNLMRADATFK